MVTRGSSRCHPRGLGTCQHKTWVRNGTYIPDNENSWVLRELVFLSTSLEIDLATNGITEVNLAVEHVGKSGCARVYMCVSATSSARRVSLTFKVGHEGLGTAVQGVDNHLPVGGASDFDETVLETRGGLDTVPRWLVADGGCLWEEVEWDTRVVTALGILAGVEEGTAGRFKGAVEGGEELEGVLGENLGLCVCSRL